MGQAMIKGSGVSFWLRSPCYNINNNNNNNDNVTYVNSDGSFNNNNANNTNGVRADFPARQFKVSKYVDTPRTGGKEFVPSYQVFTWVENMFSGR